MFGLLARSSHLDRLTVINVLVISLWTGLDRPEWARVNVQHDEHGRAIESHGFCSYRDSIPYVVSLAVIFVGTLAFACYEAYMARKISTEFAESEYIDKAMSFILIVCFIGNPVLIIATEDQRTLFFVAAAIFFVVSASLLVMIFLPKALHSKVKTKSPSLRVSISTSKGRTCPPTDKSRCSTEHCSRRRVGQCSRFESCGQPPGSTELTNAQVNGLDATRPCSVPISTETGSLVRLEESNLHHRSTNVD